MKSSVEVLDYGMCVEFVVPISSEK